MDAPNSKREFHRVLFRSINISILLSIYCKYSDTCSGYKLNKERNSHFTNIFNLVNSNSEIDVEVAYIESLIGFFKLFFYFLFFLFFLFIFYFFDKQNVRAPNMLRAFHHAIEICEARENIPAFQVDLKNLSEVRFKT
jgi:hypothetical protein